MFHSLSASNARARLIEVLSALHIIGTNGVTLSLVARLYNGRTVDGWFLLLKNPTTTRDTTFID